MNLPTFLKTSADSPATAPKGGGAKVMKTAENPATDGFAALVTKLSKKDDKVALPTTGVETLPVKAAKTGKILPLAEQVLAETDEKGSADDKVRSNGEGNGTDDADPLNQIALVIPAGMPAIVQIVGEPKAEAKPDQTVDVTSAVVSKFTQGTPNAAPQKLDNAQPRVKADGTPIVRAKPVENNRVAIQTEQATGKVLANISDRLTKAGTDAGHQAAGLETSTPKGPATRTAGITLNIAAADKAVDHTGNSARRDEGASNGSNAETGSEAMLGTARSAAPDQLGKLFDLASTAQIGAKPAQPSVSSANASSAPSPQTAMSAEGIAHFVDRLSLARDFDLTQSASLVVKHQDFGPLTVTFDHAHNGLDVQIAAQDAETQRALASAMATDRNALRTADGHNAVQASQSASAGGDRNPGASGQQAFASNGGAHPGDRSAGQSANQFSSQTSGQSSQHGGRASSQRQPNHRGNPRTTSDDGALYA